MFDPYILDCHFDTHARKPPTSKKHKTLHHRSYHASLHHISRKKNISSTAVKSESARISQGSLPMNPKPFSSFQVLTVPLFDMPHPRAAEQLGGQSHARSRVTFMCANEGKPLAPQLVQNQWNLCCFGGSRWQCQFVFSCFLFLKKGKSPSSRTSFISSDSCSLYQPCILYYDLQRTSKTTTLLLRTCVSVPEGV